MRGFDRLNHREGASTAGGVPRADTARLVQARVGHRRSRPFTYRFEHRTTMWLVDLSDPNAAFPRWLRPLASIRSADHFAPHDDRPLPEKLRDYLDAQGIGWTAARTLMLTNARSLGYVFDPLTTYFCFDSAGSLEGVVAEVHNTYGERHAYPLPVTERPANGTGPGTDTGVDTVVDKEFYVSPFFAVEGRYDIRTRLDDDRVMVAISLAQGEETVFTGSVTGALHPATPARTVRAVAANPSPSHRVSALIRWHGIKLWLRRLPVIPRRPHRAPKGMA